MKRLSVITEKGYALMAAPMEDEGRRKKWRGLSALRGIRLKSR